ncbi:hypothetical protein KBC80_04020 [Candidatus Woesebacteria bacterium]|nr:hypothetical protein [Candidatus Woesebacteria bacterium]
MAIKSKKSKVSTVVWVTTLLIVLVSVFVLSGNFTKLITTISKSKASLSNAKLTTSFGDAFKTEAINTEKWTVRTNGDASMAQSANNNLRVTIPAGSDNNKVKAANITFNELFDQKADFRVVAVTYRPIVTGDGAGVTGIRFTSKGEDNDEGVVLQWKVSGNTSVISFVVRDAKGKKLESQQESLQSNIAVLRIDRVNKRYRAYYKLGNDITGDVGWKSLGTEWDAKLGSEGKISLFTNNAGFENKFPKVVGRFDQATIAWESDTAKNTNDFSDAFANGHIGVMWLTGGSEGAQIYENPKDNLIMPVLSGANGVKPRYSLLTRKEPIIANGKDFTIKAIMFKPTVVSDGAGTGFAGVRFYSTESSDDEGSTVRWIVGKVMVNNVLTNVSKLAFTVRGATTQSVDVPASHAKLTIRLVRSGNEFQAWYRAGDSDTDWKMIGDKQTGNFQAAGKVGLIVSNAGVAAKYPRVVGRFDQVTGSISK